MDRTAGMISRRAPPGSRNGTTVGCQPPVRRIAWMNQFPAAFPVLGFSRTGVLRPGRPGVSKGTPPSGVSVRPGGWFVDRPNPSRSDDPSILRDNNVGAASRSRKQRRRLFIHGPGRFPTNDQQGFHSPRLSGSTPGLPKIERKREDNIITESAGRLRALRTRVTGGARAVGKPTCSGRKRFLRRGSIKHSSAVERRATMTKQAP
jgi:hypothetical protein